MHRVPTASLTHPHSTSVKFSLKQYSQMPRNDKVHNVKLIAEPLWIE